jgi:aspartyl protease family protein
MNKRYVLIAIITASILLFITKCSRLDVDVVSINNEKLPNIVYMVILLITFITMFVNYKIPIGTAIKYASVWILIIGTLLVGYTYKSELKGVYEKVYANIIPGSVIVGDLGNITVVANESGHFFVDTVVNGIDMKFLIDTGATTVSLTRYDAKRLGIDTSKLSYTNRVSTANGLTWSASVKLDYIQVGDITIYNIPASVGIEDKLGTSLLGMSFLNRLKSYNVSNNTLTMVAK